MTATDFQPESSRRVGEWTEAAPARITDPETGVEYEVISGGIANNTHIYFNRANFTCEGKHLIFRSDRTFKVHTFDLAGEVQVDRDAVLGERVWG